MEQQIMTSREKRAAKLVSVGVCLSDISNWDIFVSPSNKGIFQYYGFFEQKEGTRKNGNGISHYMTSISFCQETNFFI